MFFSEILFYIYLYKCIFYDFKCFLYSSILYFGLLIFEYTLCDYIKFRCVCQCACTRVCVRERD